MSHMSKISQYEIEREANIARNHQLIAKLELQQSSKHLEILDKARETKTEPFQPVQPVKKRKLALEVPIRRSSRLNSGLTYVKESPMKRKKEGVLTKEKEAVREAEERKRIANRPRTGDLDLRTLLRKEEGKDCSSLSRMLMNVDKYPHTYCIGESTSVTHDDPIEDDTDVSNLKNRLQNLKIVSRAKVTQDRVYSSAYHPDATKDLVFFGDKHGQLGIWDARAQPKEIVDEDGEMISGDLEDGNYWRLQVHWPATSRSSISCIKFDPIDSLKVYTSSYDCTIRMLSFETGVSRQIYSSGEDLVTGFDLMPAGNEMWISDNAGGASHLDFRECNSKRRRYKLSDQKIGSISVNPTRSYLLLTASNDRSLKVWDTRCLRNLHLEKTSQFLGKECGLCLESWHSKSVSSAFWDPRGKGIVSTCYDDTLRLWDINSANLDDSTPFSSRFFKSIRHNCQTGKWLTILKAQWSKNPDVLPYFTIGNMNHALDIFSGKGDLIARLEDSSKITAVQAVTCSHPRVIESVASGNASGRCVLWGISR